MAQKKPSNPTQTVGAIAALLIILGIGGTYQFLNPGLQLASTNLSQAKAKNQSYITDIATLQKAQTDVDTAKRTLTDKGLDFSSIRYIFPQNEEIPNLYIQMEYLTTNSAGVTSSYQISPPISNAPGDVRIPLSFNATGTYADLKAFITALENNIRPVILTTLSFGPAPDKDQQGKAVQDAGNKLTLNLSGFVRSQGLSAAYSSTTTKK